MKEFQNILVTVDTRFSEHPALQWAVRLAEQNRAKLKIVDTMRELPWLAKFAVSDSEDRNEAFAAQKRQLLESIAQPVRDRGLEVETDVLVGKTSLAIIREVSRSGHDLVFRLTKGASSSRTGFFGTTSMRLLRGCPCAVWLVRPDVPPHIQRVLAAVDPAPNDSTRETMNRRIMELASSIADYEDGQLYVVHAWELFGEQLLKSKHSPKELERVNKELESRVAAALDRVLSPFGLDHNDQHVYLLHEKRGPGYALSALANQEKIDLVVMGTIARSGLHGALMGNTAEQVLDRIESAVLAIKPEHFKSLVIREDD